MILYGGTIYDSSEQDKLLDVIEPYINRTLAQKTLPVEKVIAAIDCLGKEVAEGRFDACLESVQTGSPQRYKLLAAQMLSRANLEFKLKTELAGLQEHSRTAPPNGMKPILVKTMPLGVIFHIAAGNIDGLPAFSLAEGLLTGNVNILKLPQADSGLSLQIISRLIALEPELEDYIFVFDTPSNDIRAMTRMAQLADGISVWGGDAAVHAVRSLAPAGAKLMEWGHKLSFCYLSDNDFSSGNFIDNLELTALAEHIAATRQLLCSSCQTIFIDTDDVSVLHRFCKGFLPILEKASARHCAESHDERAYLTLLRHTEYLEDMLGHTPNPNTEYRGNGCRLIICPDDALECSPMLCSVLVKRLPRDRIVPALRQKKGYLQTAGLICAQQNRDALTQLLARCGVTRITSAGNMSAYFSGESHDGEYPLRRYVRTVNVEINDA